MIEMTIQPRRKKRMNAYFGHLQHQMYVSTGSQMMRHGGGNDLRGYKWRGRKIQEEVGVVRRGDDIEVQ